MCVAGHAALNSGSVTSPEENWGYLVSERSTKKHFLTGSTFTVERRNTNNLILRKKTISTTQVVLERSDDTATVMITDRRYGVYN